MNLNEMKIEEYYSVGDYVVFVKGKYVGQVGVIERITPQKIGVRIAPHCPNGLTYTQVYPDAVRDMTNEELVAVNDWDWELLCSVVHLYWSVKFW